MRGVFLPGLLLRSIFALTISSRAGKVWLVGHKHPSNQPDLVSNIKGSKECYSLGQNPTCKFRGAIPFTELQNDT